MGLLAVTSSVGAAGMQERDGRCMTTSLFGFKELVIAPVLGDAIGVVLGTSLTEHGVGATLLVRPHACSSVGGTVSFGHGSSGPRAPDAGNLGSVPVVP